MTAKKRWFSKVYSSESPEGGKSDPEISWAISDSETEVSPESPLSKKRKKSTTWIKLSNNTSPRRCPENTTHNFLESPIITGLNLEEQSPVLTQRSDSFSKEQSPVIGRRDILRRIKARSKNQNEVIQINDNNASISFNLNDVAIPKMYDSSPEIFPSQSLVIIDSQLSTTKESPVKISPSKSQKTQSWKIDPFPSQHSSPVVVDSASFSPSNSDSHSPLYHQPPKKKRFKQGGLAWQLTKALRAQKNSLVIWQHELYLNELKGVPTKGNESRLSFKFTVVKEFEEYGCRILQCEYVKMRRLEASTSFLLVNTNISVEAGVTYRIFPPYGSRIVERGSQKIRCIFNTSKVCVSKQENLQ